MDIVDHFITNYGLILVGIFTALAAGWTAGGAKVRDEIAKVSTWFPANVWWWNIRLVVPIVLTVLLVATFIKELAAPYEGYPTWALSIGWVAVFLPLVIGFFLNKWYGQKA